MTEVVGKRIRDRRKELDMTQEKLSEKSNVSRGTIAALEAGTCRDVLVGTLAAIAEALGVPVDSFFTPDV